MLDVWPALPLSIVSHNDNPTGSVDNIIAALKCTNRVCRIFLSIVRSFGLDILLAEMQQPFPELTYLELSLGRETVPVFPDSFLGGSAPRLEWLQLYGISFPSLPKLLRSATHLVTLHLHQIPHSGYFSPDAMATVLSTLTSLDSLSLSFESHRFCPDPANRRLSPSTCSALPVLTVFLFKGVSEYLDDFVACISAPQLNKLEITVFNDIEFYTPQFTQFISRSTPVSRAPDKAHITFQDRAARVSFSSQTSRDWVFYLEILCKGLDWQVSFLEHVCTSCLPLLYMLDDLYFHEDSDSQPDWEDNIESEEWLELLRPFKTVKNLYLSEKLASCIATALRGPVEGRTTNVLPALRNIFLKGLDSSGSVQESIRRFVAVRRVANLPISISPWTNSTENIILRWTGTNRCTSFATFRNDC